MKACICNLKELLILPSPKECKLFPIRFPEGLSFAKVKDLSFPPLYQPCTIFRLFMLSPFSTRKFPLLQRSLNPKKRFGFLFKNHHLLSTQLGWHDHSCSSFSWMTFPWDCIKSITSYRSSTMSIPSLTSFAWKDQNFNSYWIVSLSMVKNLIELNLAS